MGKEPKRGYRFFPCVFFLSIFFLLPFVQAGLSRSESRHPAFLLPSCQLILDTQTATFAVNIAHVSKLWTRLAEYAVANTGLLIMPLRLMPPILYPSSLMRYALSVAGASSAILHPKQQRKTGRIYKPPTMLAMRQSQIK